MPVTFFTSNALTSNHYILYTPNTWKSSLIAVLKYETHNSLTYLSESTAIDTYKYTPFQHSDNLSSELTRFLKVENLYSLYSRTRYTVIEAISKKPIYTSSIFFKNAIWLERELIEMYGVLIHTYFDTRNLLLEYSFTDYPMVKTYPCEGYVDIYYDFFRDQLCYVNHDYVEL